MKSKKRRQERFQSDNPCIKKVKLKKIMMSMMKTMQLVSLPISTAVTESQPTVTCSTLYNWSTNPLASLDHSYCMNEENMSLPSHSDLADEIEEPKIENNILKDKIKAN